MLAGGGVVHPHPLLVVQVPAHGFSQYPFKGGAGSQAQLCLELGGDDGVAQVVPGAGGFAAAAGRMGYFVVSPVFMRGHRNFQ